MNADAPTLFDAGAKKAEARIEELEAELKTERTETARLNNLYVRYRKEAKETTDRTRALIRKEAWEALQPTDMFQQPLVDEIKWLRRHITRTGRDLHRQFGHTDGTRCDCPGCELIISTDLREPGDIPEGDLGPRTSLYQRLIEAETERDQARNALAAHKALDPNRERTI